MIWIWVVGILLGAWTTLNFAINEFFTEDRLFGCRRAFQVNYEFFNQHHNFGLTFLVTGVMPQITMGYLYYKIIMRLKEIEVASYYTPLKDELDENKKLTKMLIAVVIAYFLLGSPVYIFLITDAFYKNLLPDSCGSGNAQPVYYMLSYWMASSANCVNPFIYCWLSDVFKQDLKRFGSSYATNV